ncbi:RelA/SpoT domain-containing protein [Candidatus Woesearchaeota archaeon]|nr:RelA/SpoT domain-containing protein [Candidatus Woesearchaeota archaeon]
MPDEKYDTVDLRSEFDERRKRYERLIHLVTQIINSAIEHNGIRIHSFKQRVKDYTSFFEKIDRKNYDDPFRECTDIAGCRIVCLFLSQVQEIKKLIKEEFEVIEVTDKRTAKKFDQFGYISVHMLVKIPKHRLKFVEYSDLGDLICEIQIRTVLQEAWAEIEHYLNYKATKEEKNEALLRKMFSLSGMFEVADSTFEEIYEGFNKMVEQKHDDSITALHLFQFSKEFFDWDEEWDKSQERKFYRLSHEVKRLNIKSISDLQDILAKYPRELKRYEKTRELASPIDLIRAALSLEYAEKFDFIVGVRGFGDRIKSDVLERKYKKW